GTDQKTLRSFHMRATGCDIDVRVRLDDEFEVEDAGDALDHLGTDVVTACKRDVVADIALARRRAALFGARRMRLEQNAGAVRRVGRKALPDHLNPPGPQLDEGLGLFLAPGHGSEKPK